MKKLKGFTLLELIIVMAIFSIIMYSAVQLLDPVSKFFVRSSNFENTTACTDNMRRCIEGNLKFADRVRCYNGYAPYDGAPSNPSADMQSKVQKFYMDFFKNRKFIDCSGQINVLVFDNTLLQADISGMSQISQYTESALNQGKIILYQFPFNNYSGDDENSVLTNMLPVNEWCVNQKLYGNFDYSFSLNAVSDAVVSGNTNPYVTTVAGMTTEPIATIIGTDVSGNPTPIPFPVATFNPRDFNIGISVREIKRVRKSDGSRGLERAVPTTDIVASFAMKNVLNASDGYRTASVDYVPTLASGDEHGTHRYEIGNPVPRYEGIDNNNTGANGFDGFYFIYTLPDEMHDVVEDSVNYDPAFLNQQEALASSTPAPAT